MSEHSETLADIVAEMRIFKCRNLETGELELCNAIANYFADRIEAARERERGNSAAMREALEAVMELFWDMQVLGRSPISNKAYAVKRKVKAALAAPPHEAKWTANGGYEFACCSSCGHLQYAGWDSRAEQAEKISDFHELYKFCPNCGAQMKGETNGSK